MSNPFRLTLRGTYILPSGAGLLQGLAWTLLLVASLNFNLGVMLLVTLLLGALALVSMVETVRNLAGIEVELAPPAPVAAGSCACVTVHLRVTDRRPRPAVLIGLLVADSSLSWRSRFGLRAPPDTVQVDLPGDGTSVAFPLQAQTRGRLPVLRVLVASRWPLGLFRAWRSWAPEVSLAFHPEPLAAPSQAHRPDTLPEGADVPVGAASSRSGESEDGDFAGHRRRAAGDPHRRVDWRASLRASLQLVAQREPLPERAPKLLRWEDHAPADAEIRLARLTGQVLEASRAGRSFGLELPGQALAIGSGPLQRDLALQLLADFPADSGNTPGLPRAPIAQYRSRAAGSDSAARPGLPNAALLRWTLGVTLAGMPLAVQLPPNAWLPWVGLLAARLLLIWAQRPPPSTFWLSAAALAAAGWIYANYHTLIGRDPGMALLLVMAGLKLIEVRRERDLHMLSVLSFFLLLSAHFRTQSPWLAAWDVLVISLVLFGLLAAQQAGRVPARRTTLLRMGLLALPLGALLFVLLPRPENAFWGVGGDSEAESGSLSDRMSPGSISHLRLSDRVAFRVHFAGAWPLSPRLYWRGPVLDHFDGVSWTAESNLAPRRVRVERGSSHVDYTYEGESGDGEWVFALELVEAGDHDLRIDGEGVARAGPASQNRAWHLRAWTDAHLEADATPAALAEDLVLPDGNPQTRALAQQWQALPTANARIDAAQRAFLAARLIYSLEVPQSGADPIDDLLFRTRTGYCEHFASAFAFMLRAAGVPARVVTGYQGGERNPLGDYLIVRQSDAHAWVEAWVGGIGWRRIDPTALTVPSRLAGGSQVAAPLPAPAWMPDFVRAGLPVWHRLQLLRDVAAMRWQRDVANLDAREQRALLASLGLDGIPKSRLAAACALLISAALGVQVLAMRRRPLRRVSDPGRPTGQQGASPTDVRGLAQRALAQRARRRWRRYDQLGAWLLRSAGLPRHADEGPGDYRQRLVRSRPALAAAVDGWSGPCMIAMYGSDAQVLALGPATRGEAHLLRLLVVITRMQLGRMRGDPTARPPAKDNPP